MKMPCPICKKVVDIKDPFMPFCGARCRTIDLGNWATEKYVISEPLRPEDLEGLVDEAQRVRSDAPPETREPSLRTRFARYSKDSAEEA